MDIREAYKVMQEASGIKAGDTVRVIRRAKDNEMGWDNSWSNGRKEDMIGREFLVTSKMPGTQGFVVGGNYLPFFILEKIADAPAKSPIDEALSRCDFGCRTEDVKRIVEAIVKECKK